jgi:sn-glycerol 3-phosphate transport system substrate-binding protein
MKKAIRLTVILLMLIWVISGCSSGKTDGDGKKDGKIELTFYYPVDVGGPLTKIIEGYAAEFNKENPDIVVKPVFTGSYEDTMTKTQSAVQGKNPPDVAVLLSTNLYDLIDMDAIIPLDDLIKEHNDQKFVDGFYPAFMANAKTGGKIWSIPFQRSTIVLYYNKDAFKSAGLDPNKPPKTWDELVSYGKKLTKDGKYGVEIPSTDFTYWMFQALALQNGKNLMSEDGTEVYFNTPSNVEALQFFADLGSKYKVSPEGINNWATVPSDFLAGKTAMMYHSTGNLTNVKNKANFDFGVAFLPQKQQYGSPTGGGDFYIFKGISKEKQEAAWKFIKWMTSPERTAQWSIDTGYVATSPAAYETDKMKQYIAEFPQAAVARDQLQYAHAELMTHQNGQIYKLVNDTLQSAIAGKTSPEEALKTIQEKAEEILAPFKK